MPVSSPPIPQRIGFGFRKILTDVGRRQFVNVGEQVLQPGVPGLFRGSDENAKIVSHHLLCGIITTDIGFARQEELVYALSASGLRVNDRVRASMKRCRVVGNKER